MKDVQNPSALMRPAPFWSWNDKLDEAELRRQIREMAEKGWGSYFMHSRVGLVTGYLSDEWMKLVTACADEADRTGTCAWLYDEDKWPSGFAGGEVPQKDEKHRSRALVLLKKGTRSEDDAPLVEVSHAGVEYEICKRVSPLGDLRFNGACYVDLMSPDAVQEFMNCTHERYREACGKYFGGAIPGIFTDEPCYVRNLDYPVPVVPWSDFLPAFFQDLKGYDITERLALLFFEIDGYRKVRLDFYDAATELFKRSFTKQYYDWCEKNRLIMTGHFMEEDSLTSQTMWSGDVMSHYEFMHWPGIDKLGRHIEQTVTVKQLSSAVDQLGKERAFCEVFGCIGGQVSFFHRKWIGDWQAVLGVSFVNHHLSLYSMRGERKRDYPPNLFYQQPWWDDERGFADYEARLCALVSGGERLVEVLVLQPLTSVWCEYSPLHKESDFAPERVYDGPFEKLSRRLLEEKLDFHYGNENLMAKYGSVSLGSESEAGSGSGFGCSVGYGRNQTECDPGSQTQPGSGQPRKPGAAKLRVGRHLYSCVIVPPASNLKSSTLALLKEFVAGGGALILIGAVPHLVDGEDRHPVLPGSRVVVSVDEAVRMAGMLFPDRIKVKDEMTGGNAPSVYLHSRRAGGSTRHLFVNTDARREVSGAVHMGTHAGRDIAVLDLYDGKLYRVESTDGSFNVALAPAGSLVVICGDEATEATKTGAGNVPSYLGSGAGFKNLSTALPAVLIDDFDCEIMEENTFLLNDFCLELGGKKVHEGPVAAAWHQHFYSAENGTPFRATYDFYSETDLTGCFAAIELAENLDAISFNGKPAKPLKNPGEQGAFDPAKSWKDINFTKVPLPEIAKGRNILVIEGKKINNITGPAWHERVEDWKAHRPTEAEEVYVCGRFSVKRLSEGKFGLMAFRKPSGKNLTAEGFPFYCGRARFQASFDIRRRPEGRVYLGLSGAKVACARIKLNGIECGTLRWPPFVIEVTGLVRQAENFLEVEATTTLVNAFGPNRRAGVKEETGIGPHSFAGMARHTKSYELFGFGIESAAVYVEGDE